MSTPHSTAGYCLNFILQKPRLAIGLVVIFNITLVLFFFNSDERKSLIYGLELTRPYQQENYAEWKSSDHEEACFNYRKMASMDRPKALDIFGNTPYIRENHLESITLITHLSDDRLDRLLTILQHWNGPVAATIHTNESQIKSLMSNILSSQQISNRPNLQLHLVQKEGDLYPVNYLRNTGLNASVTKFVFPVDVDLIPSHDAHARLTNYAEKMNDGVLIVPAFQEANNSSKVESRFPRTKDELISLWDAEHVMPFLTGPNQCNKCHKSTNFPQWRTTNDIYQAQYRRYFEPYTVGRRDRLPIFSEMFGGRYKDKISFVEEIYAKELILNVVPDVFLLHMWHEQSDQFNIEWSRCSNIAEETFEKYLKERYPNFSPWW